MKILPENHRVINPTGYWEPTSEGGTASTFLPSLTEQLLDLKAFIDFSVEKGLLAHEVEQEVWNRMLELGRRSLSLYFEKVGDGDQGEEVTLPDGRCLHRFGKLHKRPYQSVFGAFEIERFVYGKREGQKIEYVPVDEHLGLPASKYSYLLQDWDQSLVVESSYAEVSRTMQRILGFSQPVDSLERMSRKMADSVVDYWDGLEIPPSEEEGEIQVLSADGKGIPMRRPSKTPRIEHHQASKGPKPDSKRMALLGASYSVDRFARTPEEIVASLFRDPETSEKPKGKRPTPCHKRVRASMARCEKDTMQPSYEEIFGWLSGEADQRNPNGERPLVVLMDGQQSLWNAAKSSLPENTVEIIDFLHVTPRLWNAAHVFHSQGSPEASEFVQKRALMILSGQVKSVIKGLKRMATCNGIKGKKLEQLKSVWGYFEEHQHRMKYDLYLAGGYPIATGVIEGACRHLVKDRLERSGMRWTFEGAQALLDLRSIHIGEQWAGLQKFRIQQETERLYQNVRLHDSYYCKIAA